MSTVNCHKSLKKKMVLSIQISLFPQPHFCPGLMTFSYQQASVSWPRYIYTRERKALQPRLPPHHPPPPPPCRVSPFSGVLGLVGAAQLLSQTLRIMWWKTRVRSGPWTGSWYKQDQPFSLQILMRRCDAYSTQPCTNTTSPWGRVCKGPVLWPTRLTTWLLSTYFPGR